MSPHTFCDSVQDVDVGAFPEGEYVEFVTTKELLYGVWAV